MTWKKLLNPDPVQEVLAFEIVALNVTGVLSIASLGVGAAAVRSGLSSLHCGEFAPPFDPGQIHVQAVVPSTLLILAAGVVQL